jgi:hypothetical protein
VDVEEEVEPLGADTNFFEVVRLSECGDDGEALLGYGCFAGEFMWVSLGCLEEGIGLWREEVCNENMLFGSSIDILEAGIMTKIPLDWLRYEIEETT